MTEWNVGCERCHGPGADHVKAPTKTNIENPDKLADRAANDVCIQCHSQGRPTKNPIAGNYYDWPVGYRVGLALGDFWSLEAHTPGELTFTHFADGTAHKNRMQGNDFVQSVMYQHGIRCFDCHDVHGSPNRGQVVDVGNALCLRCHEAGGTNGPRTATLEAHTHHAAASTGSQCIACHMPENAETLGPVKVRSHTFKFVTPTSATPNPCTLCHADKPASWASNAIAAW
ncbi:MAG: cytochrome c3 family protein [Kofleriaceae bacterium]